MDYTKQFTQDFYGASTIKGQPWYVTDGVWKLPGTVVDAVYTAYFGRVVSSDEATYNQFLMGSQGAKVVGVLINEAGVNQNDPFKNNYRLQYEPATAVAKGGVWIKGFTSASAGALATPLRTSVIIYSTTTGAIEFIGPTTAVPSGFAVLSGHVMEVDLSGNGVLIWVGDETATAAASSTCTLNTFGVCLTGVTGFSATAAIVESTGAVSVTVPAATTVTALISMFTYTGASIKISTTAQVSGVTTNNFTSPVVYRVTAADGTYKDYTVAVTVHS
jgi:hypothetical protein